MFGDSDPAFELSESESELDPDPDSELDPDPDPELFPSKTDSFSTWPGKTQWPKSLPALYSIFGSSLDHPSLKDRYFVISSLPVLVDH